MGIEQEIKQRNFRNEYQKLIINQLFTGKWVSDIVSQHLKPFDLTMQQYNVLRILRGQKDHTLSVNGITERMIDKMSNVSRLVDKLLLKKLIQRKTNKIDRRQVDVIITHKGLQLLAEIDQNQDSMEQQFKNLSTNEAVKLNQLLDKLRGDIE